MGKGNLMQHSVGRREFLRDVSLAGAAGAAGLAAASRNEALGGDPRSDDPALARFSQQVGTRFEIEDSSGNRATVALIEASPVDSPGRTVHRKPFSLVFRAALGVRLGQDLNQVRHPKLGSMRLLLVPVDLPAKVNHLQAVFG